MTVGMPRGWSGGSSGRADALSDHKWTRVLYQRWHYRQPVPAPRFAPFSWCGIECAGVGFVSRDICRQASPLGAEAATGFFLSCLAPGWQ